MEYVSSVFQFPTELLVFRSSLLFCDSGKSSPMGGGVSPDFVTTRSSKKVHAGITI